MEAGFVASWFTAEFQEIKWKSLVNSEDERISLDALKYLTDRLYGKASQALAISDADGGPIQFVTKSILED